MEKHSCPKTLNVARGGKLFEGCPLCLPSKLQQGNSAAYDRQWQRTHYRRDLTQPNDPQNFVKAFGADVAREHGYTEEQIRKYS